jgi:predicted PurR-regulated permease PerM
MESNLNIIYLVLGISTFIISAIGTLFYKVYSFGKEKKEEETNYSEVLKAIENLRKDIKNEIALETSKIQNDWDKWQIKQEANNMSQDKEIMSLQKSQRDIQSKFESALNNLYSEINSINKTLTQLLTIQAQEDKQERRPTRAR